MTSSCTSQIIETQGLSTYLQRLKQLNPHSYKKIGAFRCVHLVRVRCTSNVSSSVSHLYCSFITDNIAVITAKHQCKAMKIVSVK